MKRLAAVLGLVFSLSLPYQAAALEPLIVAVDTFSPAFVMQSGGNHFYGFDIGMMESICKLIQRRCVFRPMPFSKLIEAVETKKADVAVGSITINPERSERVNFSTPYLPSQGRFVMLKQNDTKPFTIESLSNQTIGIETGTMFAQALASWPVTNPVIKEYPTPEDLVNALKNGEITYIAADNPGVMFWQAQTSDDFAVLGKPFDYGFGLGIAVNKSDTTLLSDINRALVQYLGSSDFKTNFDTYLNYFQTD